jgi:hypothetical protein
VGRTARFRCHVRGMSGPCRDLAEAPLASMRHGKRCLLALAAVVLAAACTQAPAASPTVTPATLADGQLELRLKHPWRDGTGAILLEPDDLMVRLVSAVPPPRWHLLRYFGVISSHSRLRREVVPHPPADPSATAPPPAPGDQLELELDADADDEPAPRKRWAWLLRHVFQADLDICPRCGGPMRWLEAAATRESARDLLARLGLGPRPPPLPKPPPPGQLALPFAR